MTITSANEKLTEHMTIGKVYHLFYRDRSSSKRERRAIVFLLEDGRLCAVTINEYMGNLYKERVTGLKPGQMRDTGKKFLVMLSADNTTACLALSKRSKEISFDRGLNLKNDVLRCLRMTECTEDHTPIMICHVEKTDGDPCRNVYKKYMSVGADPVVKFYYPEEPDFSFFDENIDKVDQLPISSVILDRITEKGRATVSMFKYLCVLVSNLLKKVFVKKK